MFSGAENSSPEKVSETSPRSLQSGAPSEKEPFLAAHPTYIPNDSSTHVPTS
jgi:hypothetical protein